MSQEPDWPVGIGPWPRTFWVFAVQSERFLAQGESVSRGFSVFLNRESGGPAGAAWFLGGRGKGCCMGKTGALPRILL